MRSRRRVQGNVVLICLVLSVLLMGLVASSVSLALTSNRWFTHLMNQTELVALAESATELRQSEVLDEIANFAPDATLLGKRTYTLSKGGAPVIIFSDVVRETVAGGGDEVTSTDADGVSVFQSYYKITGEATVDGYNSQVTRTIQVGRSPLFQYAVFYDDDLEILPGPDMTLGGRIHANGDVYLNSGNTLFVDSEYLRCTGEIFRGRKDDASAPGGTIMVRDQSSGLYESLDVTMAPGERWIDGVSDPLYYDNYGGDPNAWVAFADARWGGTVQTQAHGMKEVAAPHYPTLKAGGHYHNEAGLVLEYTDGGLRALRRDGGGCEVDVTGDLPADTISMDSLYDAREGQKVSVLEVDMEKLRDSGYYPDNGLTYAYRDDTTVANPHGVLFKNGKELEKPTFLVSPDPVYVEGDFNAPAGGSGYSKQAAMVMCDAINILSNNWDGSKASGTGLPDASQTTINLAMLSGIVRTPDDPDGSYSGGLENYPRLHESWGGVELKIGGSFNCLFESTYAQGTWKYGSPLYKAPIRNWTFDPDLLKHQAAFMRDIMPFAVYVRRVAWDDNLNTTLD